MSHPSNQGMDIEGATLVPSSDVIAAPAVSPTSQASSGTDTAPLTPRKQLPPLPKDAEAQERELAALRANPRSPLFNTLVQQSPIFVEYFLLAEYNKLMRERIPGVYVIPSDSSPRVWLGVLFIRQGVYVGGTFRFKITIPESYPDGDCPSVVFEPPVFHPMIDPETGKLNVKTAYPKWRKNVNHVWHVVLYARRIFFKIDTKNCYNKEAAVLYEQSQDMYNSKVAESLKLCQGMLTAIPDTADTNSLRFSQYDPDHHADTLRRILRPEESYPADESKNAQTSGLSWLNWAKSPRLSAPHAQGYGECKASELEEAQAKGRDEDQTGVHAEGQAEGHAEGQTSGGDEGQQPVGSGGQSPEPQLASS